MIKKKFMWKMQKWNETVLFGMICKFCHRLYHFFLFECALISFLSLPFLFVREVVRYHKILAYKWWYAKVRANEIRYYANCVLPLFFQAKAQHISTIHIWQRKTKCIRNNLHCFFDYFLWYLVGCFSFTDER